MAKVDLLTEHHTAHIIIEGLTTIIPVFLRFGRGKEFKSLLEMSIAMLFDEMLRGGSDVNALEWIASPRYLILHGGIVSKNTNRLEVPIPRDTPILQSR